MDKIWTFRPFFSSYVVVMIEVCFYPHSYVRCLSVIMIFSHFWPVPQTPKPHGPPSHIWPLGPNNYIHPLKALVLWSLLQKSLCSVRTFLSIKNKSFQNSKNWIDGTKSERIMPILKGFFPILVFKYVSILTELCEWNTAGINKHKGHLMSVLKMLWD